ncbi:MAG: hypothetical protein ACYCYF_07790, partial [Anaerolineae bacterium]
MYRRAKWILALLLAVLGAVSCAPDSQPGAGTAVPDRSPARTITPALPVVATRPVKEATVPAQVKGQAYVNSA